jgi:hypothetical protein
VHGTRAVKRYPGCVRLRDQRGPFGVLKTSHAQLVPSVVIPSADAGRVVTLRCTGRIAAFRAGSENLPKVTRIGPLRWQYHEAGRGGKGHLLDLSHLEGAKSREAAKRALASARGEGCWGVMAGTDGHRSQVAYADEPGVVSDHGGTCCQCD